MNDDNEALDNILKEMANSYQELITPMSEESVTYDSGKEIERAVAISMYLRRVGNGNKCWRYRGGEYNYKCDWYKTGGDGRGDYERKR